MDNHAESDDDTSKISCHLPPFPHWQVWKAATRLSEHGISSPSNAPYLNTTVQVVSILRLWGNTWAGNPAWKSLLNKNSLVHEAEESIVALFHLHEWIQSRQVKTTVTVVDLCCGKGLFSMLLSYMVGLYWKDSGISNIVLLDKSVAIDWHHIDAANETALAENRPHLDLWKGVNLHKYDDLLDRFLQLNTTLALVGIHLCKTLSPSAISLVHGLGQTCQFLCLAPCCVPRVVTSRVMSADRRRIAIHQYESPAERSTRLTDMALRDRVLGRGGARQQCYVCWTHGHRVRDCPTLKEMHEDERRRVLKEAALVIPCWQCGKVGHYKVDCPDAGAVWAYVEPPTRYWDIESVLTSTHPFEHYCQVLAECLPSTSTVVSYDTGLKNAKVQEHDPSELNWNQGRKSIYIVAMSKD